MSRAFCPPIPGSPVFAMLLCYILNAFDVCSIKLSICRIERLFPSFPVRHIEISVSDFRYIVSNAFFPPSLFSIYRNILTFDRSCRTRFFLLPCFRHMEISISDVRHIVSNAFFPPSLFSIYRNIDIELSIYLVGHALPSFQS